jgi:hypothetical protein
LIVVPSNGAAVATLDVLQGLAASGFESQAFCTSKLDLHADVSLEKIISVSSEPYQVRPSTCASGHARVLYTRRCRVPITVVRLESTRHVQQRPEEVSTVLDLFRKPEEDIAFHGGKPVGNIAFHGGGLESLGNRRFLVLGWILLCDPPCQDRPIVGWWLLLPRYREEGAPSILKLTPRPLAV